MVYNCLCSAAQHGWLQPCLPHQQVLQQLSTNQSTKLQKSLPAPEMKAEFLQSQPSVLTVPMEDPLPGGHLLKSFFFDKGLLW